MISRKNSMYIKLGVCILIIVAAAIFVKNDHFLYERTIATAVSVSDEQVSERDVSMTDTPEKYYDQTIEAEVRNGSHKGETIILGNHYASSRVYDTKYTEGDDIFADNIKEDDGRLTGTASGMKRDFFVVLAVTVMVCLFVLIAGKDGILTTVSLVLNLGTFYFVLVLYLKGINIVLLSIPMVVIFTAMLLFFMYGRSTITMLSFAATLISVFFITVMAAIVIAASGRIDYDFMEFLIQPYDQWDADCIFLSEILIGCMGAVMDVVVTVMITVDQITKQNPSVEIKTLLRSCRNVGDDVVGTMIPVMFFTNVAAGIPFFVLSMRNEIAIHSILRYNCFFEIARFLTGSIAVVIAIPVATAVAVLYHKKRRVKEC